jgi:hypothetical protein
VLELSQDINGLRRVTAKWFPSISEHIMASPDAKLIVMWLVAATAMTSPCKVKAALSIICMYIEFLSCHRDRLCGLVVRVPGYTTEM